MNSIAGARILVLDADMIPALTVARSLHRQGCVVDVASSFERPVTGYSRAVKRSFYYPDPLEDEGTFCDWLEAHTASTPYDLVIPVTERSLVPLSRTREKFARVRIAMPAQSSLELALDKEQTMALAAGLDICVPAGPTISSLEELANCQSSVAFPVVIKPCRSVGMNENRSRQLQVSYAFNESELRAGCEEALNFGPVLLQTYFRGQGVGVEIIAHQGEVFYAFQHLRLHEVPLTGGGSTLRKSVALEPVLLEATKRLIKALDWNGVAMVEFKWNPEDASYCLMEINGRFWGSLPLAAAAGADFPAMLVELELCDKAVPCGDYREGIYCRKLATDLYWYEAVLRGEDGGGLTDIPSGWARFRDLRLFFSLRHYFDVQSFRDPAPGLRDIADMTGNYYRRLKGLVSEKLFYRRQRRAWSSGEVGRALAESQSILFLCYGNINRSALADVLLRTQLCESDVTVLSAGFHEHEDRPADPQMVAVAADRAVDLSASRSKRVTREMLASSDVIFAMEKRHMDMLEALDAESLEKTWLMGAHTQNYGVEIADPYGRPQDAYAHCFERISAAAKQIQQLVNQGKQSVSHAHD